MIYRKLTPKQEELKKKVEAGMANSPDLLEHLPLSSPNPKATNESKIEYIQKHNLAKKLEWLLAECLNAQPPDPMAFIASKLNPHVQDRLNKLVEQVEIHTSTRTLHIVHYNDVYHLEPSTDEEPIGGASRFSRHLERIWSRANPLILFSGDFMGPSLTSVITKGKHMVDCLNRLQTHYGCFGNHELDFGLDKLTQVVQGYTGTSNDEVWGGSTTRWIMSNMYDKTTGKPLGDADPDALFEWNGIQVGLLGLAENWLEHCTKVEQSKVEYRDMYTEGERLAKQLKERGAEVVIALTHNRLENDRLLMEKSPSIDLLLGGHDHFYKNDCALHRVVKSGQEFRWLTEIEVSLFHPKHEKDIDFSVNTVQITGDMETDPEMDRLITRYQAVVDSKMGKIYGKSCQPLDSTEEALRYQETILGNWVADVMKDAVEADIAIISGAAISGKKVKPVGNITLGDLFEWFPKETSVMSLEVTANDIHKILAGGVKQLPDEAHGFPHCSGITFTIDYPARGLDRVKNIKINGSPVDNNRTYVLSTTDFVALAKGPYGFLAQRKRLVQEEFAKQIVAVLKTWCKQTGDKAPVGSAAGLGRITVINEDLWAGSIALSPRTGTKLFQR